MSIVLVLLALFGLTYVVVKSPVQSLLRSIFLPIAKPPKEAVEEWQKRVSNGSHTNIDWKPKWYNNLAANAARWVSSPAWVAFLVGFGASWFIPKLIQFADLERLPNAILVGFMMVGLLQVVEIFTKSIESGKGGCGGHGKQQPPSPNAMQQRQQMMRNMQMQNGTKGPIIEPEFGAKG